MFSVIILLVSGVALVQFAIAQWRSIWISAAQQAVSDAFKAETGVDPEAIKPTDFGVLVGLYDQVCPGQKTSTPWLREITRYYRLISAVRRISEKILPRLSDWAGTEMKTCSRYVAVAIDQHLAIDLDRRAAVRCS